MKPEDIRVGDRLRYYPIVGREHFVLVEVLERPRRLGDTLVCRARSLSPEYASGPSIHPSVDHLERDEPSSKRASDDDGWTFTVFGPELGEEIRLRLERDDRSRIIAALLVSGTAINPQGSWPEAVIHLKLSPLRLRLLAEALRVGADHIENNEEDVGRVGPPRSAGRHGPQGFAMNPESMRTIERMLYPYKKGDRVRARLDIFCALRGCTVPIGTEGTIVDPKATGCIGLLLVRWDSGPEFHCSGEGVELVPS